MTAYTPPSRSSVVFNFDSAASYTPPARVGVAFNFLTGYAAIGVGGIWIVGGSTTVLPAQFSGVGQIGIAGLSLSGKKLADHIGQGVVGIHGASHTQYIPNHLGVGNIGISGSSIAAEGYNVFGVGQIGIDGLSAVEWTYQTVGVGVLGIDGQSTIATNYRTIGVGAVGISGLSSVEWTYQAVGVGGFVVSGVSVTENVITTISRGYIATKYVCVLTGGNDGLDDFILPISSYQVRMGASPYRVYLSIVVPNIDMYIDAITARPNGELKISRCYNYLDGSQEIFVIAECALDTIQTNQGARNGTTGSLSGYKQLTAGTAHIIDLFDPITRSSDSGRRRYRCRLDPRVRPLDTVTINNETFQVDQIIHIVDVSTAIMEVQELMA